MPVCSLEVYEDVNFNLLTIDADLFSWETPLETIFMEFKRLSSMEDDLFTYDLLMSYTEDELLLLWPIIESKGLVWTTIEEKDGKFQIEYMNSTKAMTKSSDQSYDIQPVQPSYMPYSEQYWGLDKSNLDDERIYAESEILFHKKLIRLMDISLEEWLELKYGDPEFAPMDERKMIGNASFDLHYDPNDVDFSEWLGSVAGNQDFWHPQIEGLTTKLNHNDDSDCSSEEWVAARFLKTNPIARNQPKPYRTFKKLTQVVQWGRSVYANIQKFIHFQLTVNVAKLVINVVAAINDGDVPLNSVQLLWANLIMDTLGALALATEPNLCNNCMWFFLENWTNRVSLTLRKKGQVVALTGDRTNEALALHEVENKIVPYWFYFFYHYPLIMLISVWLWAYKELKWQKKGVIEEMALEAICYQRSSLQLLDQILSVIEPTILGKHRFLPLVTSDGLWSFFLILYYKKYGWLLMSYFDISADAFGENGWEPASANDGVVPPNTTLRIVYSKALYKGILDADSNLFPTDILPTTDCRMQTSDAKVHSHFEEEFRKFVTKLVGLTNEKRQTETKGPIQTPKEIQPISSLINCHLGETKEATVAAAYNVASLSG
ncbi:Ca2+-ATPase [Artemisia annua]|uniref:Ca2+-ATPase n=1 Tax=Artemisia annua TaxID=35608 RepID=A0A2U1KZH9_ARTAN|nr:Ca2+-ATPase [Artemisia annua]